MTPGVSYTPVPYMRVVASTTIETPKIPAKSLSKTLTTATELPQVQINLPLVNPNPPLVDRNAPAGTPVLNVQVNASVPTTVDIPSPTCTITGTTTKPTWNTHDTTYTWTTQNATEGTILEHMTISGGKYSGYTYTIKPVSAGSMTDIDFAGDVELDVVGPGGTGVCYTTI